MKSFILLVLAIIAVAVLAGQFFVHGFSRVTPAETSLPTSTSAKAQQPGALKVAPSVNRTEFHGPTGAPHIVGPSANPPNY